MGGGAGGRLGVNFWGSENWSRRVHFEGHSSEWRVLSKLGIQPYIRGVQCKSSLQE